ncbi:uncharacterized protein LOC100822297 isoform X1 [Brachypodium distachyon]|uniref:uncharacterized protein LOC100822297 isoform X1 n=1 Tax=Brachypodium distachyon TaxID=15368 RepID=UPI000D0CBDB3|nr:uncharacterized protein LOC100822297 isoform X1 [Brachypodium distachyon]|eukprot:XP_024316275.1 uncharacterized protein LOC100822297 isoform X1 [Brachypodium distachyon]
MRKVFRRAEVEAQRKVQALRTDRGEFTSRQFAAYCEGNGIKHYLTAPYTPQQNGVVERRNQTVVGMARSLLKSKNMPGTLWGEVVSTAVYILNRSPTKSVENKTPYEAWFKRKPNIEHLRIFGCVAYAKVTKLNLSKLADKATRTVMLGYETNTKAYRLYDPATKNAIVSRDVVFDEEKGWDWSKVLEKENERAKDIFTVTYPAVVFSRTEHDDTIQSEPSTSKKATTNENSEFEPTIEEPPAAPSTPGTPQMTVVDDEKHEDQGSASEVGPQGYRNIQELMDIAPPCNLEDEELYFIGTDEPSPVSEAKQNSSWKHAMEEELKSILENDTWNMVDLPAGQKPIGLKWVFKLKKDPSGKIVKHKARLVAKGYVQRKGVDYDEVFAPVARLETVRMLAARAAQEGWEMHHMDVKSAFLNGELLEDVFVQQPPRYETKGEEHRVLKLNKALYGLKQAPRAWNAKLDASLMNLGFIRCPLEHGVYLRSTETARLIVGVYVDDLVIIGSSILEINKFKS